MPDGNVEIRIFHQRRCPRPGGGCRLSLSLTDTLDEALASLANGNGSRSVPFAGGTNLLVDIRARRMTPDALVFLGRIPGLRGIEASADQVRMGASTTVTDILTCKDLTSSGSSLVESARVFGGHNRQSVEQK